MFGRDKETEVVDGKTQRDHSVWSHRLVKAVDCQEENKLKARRLGLPTEAAIPSRVLLL